MDLILPQLDGYEATLRIRQIEETNNIRKSYICGNSAHVQRSNLI